MNVRLRHFSALAVILIGSLSLARALQDPKSTSDSKAPGEVYASVLPEEACIWVDGKPATLPATATSIPLLAAFGLVALGSGLFLKTRRR